MGAPATTAEQELFMRNIAVWNERRPDDIDDISAAEATSTDPMGTAHDRESLKEYIDMILGAFPDFHVEVHTLREGNVVASRYTFSGTMEAQYRGCEPTGESFEHHGIAWSRTEDGKVAESWNSTNGMAMAQQLGLLG